MSNKYSPTTALAAILQCNSESRIPSKDMFMLFALWMEKFPISPPPLFENVNGNARKTGCVLVDPEDRIISMECTGNSHAIVRAILNSSCNARGFDVYVSRFPCALCVRIMVQAGIRKIYYFPSKDWEISYSCQQDNNHVFCREKEEKNLKSVWRLIQSNAIALKLYIPQWMTNDLAECFHDELRRDFVVPDNWGWKLSESVKNSSSLYDRWETLFSKFQNTVLALYILYQRFSKDLHHFKEGADARLIPCKDIYRHAMVLAFIAAKRTDDPKIGVGAVLISDEDRYISVGWNGFPKKAQHFDYPLAGADDCVNDEELKYDYILHAEQNTLLWRNPTGCRLNNGAVLVSTKMPCDECSPVMADCGITKVITVPQAPKTKDDPSRLRGLTYDKLNRLVGDISIFS